MSIEEAKVVGNCDCKTDCVLARATPSHKGVNAPSGASNRMLTVAYGGRDGVVHMMMVVASGLLAEIVSSCIIILHLRSTTHGTQTGIRMARGLSIQLANIIN